MKLLVPTGQKDCASQILAGFSSGFIADESVTADGKTPLAGTVRN